MQSRFAPASGLAAGAYVLADHAEGLPEVIIIATGSEISLVAFETLSSEGVAVRVEGAPSGEPFDRQLAAHRELVLPPANLARVAVEEASTLAVPLGGH